MIWLLLSCAHTPPVLYPTPIPPMTDPAPLVWDQAPDECELVEPVIPGSPAPSTLDNMATCRGLLVPESLYAELLHHEDLGAYWESIAQLSHDGRARDRAHGQQMLDACDAQATSLARENTGLRIGSAVTGVGMLIVGTGVGIAAAKLSGI